MLLLSIIITTEYGPSLVTYYTPVQGQRILFLPLELVIEIQAIYWIQAIYLYPFVESTQ